jgi:hypothetical protein
MRSVSRGPSLLPDGGSQDGAQGPAKVGVQQVQKLEGTYDAAGSSRSQKYAARKRASVERWVRRYGTGSRKPSNTVWQRRRRDPIASATSLG